jgi:hypothetical protein
VPAKNTYLTNKYIKATPFPEVTESFCRVPSTQFSQTPSFIKCIHLCRF